MQHGIGLQVVAEPAIEGGEGVGRGEAALEEQAHRVALIAEGGLDADEDVAEGGAEDLDAPAVGLGAARRRTPLDLDLLQMRLAADMVVGADPGVEIGGGAVEGGVAEEQRIAQGIDGRRQVDAVARGGHRLQRVEERGEDREIGGGAGGAGIRREVEEDDGDAALGDRSAPQGDQPVDPGGQHGGPLPVNGHVAGGFRCGGRRPAAEDGRRDGAVEFGNGDHDGRFDRVEAARRGGPLLDGLEFEGLGGKIRHVEAGERGLGGGGVVVGGAADEGEAGQRQHRIDRGAAVPGEEALDGRAGIEPVGEGRNDREAACFERGDHAVIMACVAR